MSTPMTKDDVAVVKLIVATALLHGVLPAMIAKPMSDEAMGRSIDHVLVLADKLVERSGIESRTTP